MLLFSLSDVPVNAPASYYRAEQKFLRGYLEDAQHEASTGYQVLLFSNPPWARKFQLLEADAMAWRGLNEEVLTILADDRIMWNDTDDSIRKFALQTSALTHLHRLPEADRVLDRAEYLCSQTASRQCGAVIRSRGLLFFERGQMAEAESEFSLSLAFARSHQDGMLEATALLNLGSVAIHEEHHDEAIAYLALSYRKAHELGATAIEESAIGNEGWEHYSLGNFDKALEVFDHARSQAASLGDTGYEILWVANLAKTYAIMGQLNLAEKYDIEALKLSRQIGEQQRIIDASEDIAQLYVDEGRPDDADRFANDALSLAQKAGILLDILYCRMLQGEAAAMRHDWQRADILLTEVAAAPESQSQMKWTAQRTLASVYEAQGQTAAAEQSYKAAIGLVEGARANLKQELSRLTFLNNAARIYDDYIHFLIVHGRSDEALEAADWSRARTLQQGLGVISTAASPQRPPLRAQEIARRSNATLLFYWMGEKQSYVWAISPEKTTLASLPPKSEIVARMQRYQKTLLGLKDPLRENNLQGNQDGLDLYAMLVAPVAGALAQSRPVILFTDGEMSQLNFETLIAGAPAPHFWIEDATISSAPSIRLLAGRGTKANAAHEKLLLLGDSLSDDPSFPRLPMARSEIEKVQAKFAMGDQVVLSGPMATPAAYLAGKPEQFAYIHFVAHAAANSTDPLESAVVLSKDKATGNSYKLYAREILQHPISARLVTISACNSSGTQFFAGEGVVGLSWAFLRAGAHNTIGTLWDVSDASTPDLMDKLYSGLQQDQPPATALREAKLSLLHSNSGFSRPFYWAPFQLYSGH